MSNNIHQDLIDALNRHSSALEGFIAATKGTAASGKAGTTAAATKPAGKAAPKAKTLTVEDIKSAFAPYLSVSDKAVRAENIANVTAITEYFGVDRVTNLDEDKFAEALHYLSLYKAGKTPTFSGLEDEGTDGEGEEEAGSLV